ncbi:uncharacterized protein LOC143296282 [Babylonia areolata]|uniref:uncharacterized protein LOC143296282 n=1 Tax=Babylonia areolata TaxID=304850 RepID=UPI003FD052AD
MQNGDAVRPHHDSLNPTSFPAHSRRRIALDESSLQQLLKEELRLSILSKRHTRGQGKVQIDSCPQPLIHEMNMADVERKERRREQNRRAAQRCRRKKRMNQMSVLQNYEWIITRNQQLQQEVTHLRQEMTRLNSVLKAHRNACTCTHVPKGPLHVQRANVKLEPGEESPGAEAGYRTPPGPPPTHPSSVSRCLSLGSCQYESPVNENMQDTCSQVLPEQHNSARLQQNNLSSSFYATPTQARNPPYSPIQTIAACSSPKNMQAASCTSPVSFPVAPSNGSMNYQLQEKEHPHLTDPSHHYTVPTMEESALNMQLPAQNHEQLQADFRGSVAAFSPAHMGGPPHQQHPPPDPNGSFPLLEDLAGLSGGVGSCLFHSQAATPLSADGRRSISSVSSDVSGGSEPVNNEVVMRPENPPRDPLGEFYVTDEIAPHDLSELLSQINQSDLLFHQRSGLDEVFNDQAAGMTALPDHFLHTL